MKKKLEKGELPLKGSLVFLVTVDKKGAIGLVRLLSLLWLAMVVANPFQGFAQQTPSPTNSPLHRKLIVGCELDYPPFSLTKPDQSPDGFTVELWQAVAKEERLDYEIKVAPFHEILTGFKEGKIDVMINLAQSEARKQFTDFAVPHVTMYGAIFVRKGTSNIKSDKDLEGKALIVLNKDLAHDYAVSRGWKNLVLVDDTASGLKLLSQGNHDAMLVGKLVGLNTLREQGIKNVEPVDQRLEFFQKFAFCVKKGEPGNSELLAKINEGLAVVKANGTYDVLYEKWFGILEPRKISLAQILKYLVPAIVIILLISAAYVFERRLRLQLKQTVSVLNATLESTADGILVVDTKGKFINYNRNFINLWGLKEEELRSRNCGEVIRMVAEQTVNPEAFVARVEELYGQPEAQSFEVLHLKDGRCFERFSKPQNVDGKNYGRVWSLRDVTERERSAQQAKRFNQELEQRVQERTHQLEIAGRDLERLSYVASRTSNMVIISDAAGKIEWVNNSFERLTGWQMQEVLGRKPGHFLQGPETDLSTVQQIREAIHARRSIHFELLNYTRAGKPYWIESEICPVFDKQGQVINFIAIESDITARRDSEQELRRQRGELAELNAYLQKALKSRDEFLAAMSHELRTPLNGILTLSELLNEQAYGPLNERQQKYLAQINESGQHLLELINDILDLAKIEAGSIILEPGYCDVESMCQSSLRMVRQTALKKRQQISYHLEPADLKIWADTRRLKQVLVNLLGNAVKFTPDEGKIGLEVKADEKEVRFEVWDNGIGISADKLNRLFLPFVQLDSGLSRQFNGTGLGLALVRRLIEQHGGRVEVTSEPGKGSRFFAIVPREKAV